MQQVIGQQLLLDARHLGQLRREFVGIQRRQGVLILQLGGQKGQEGFEIVEQRRRTGIDPVLAVRGFLDGINHRLKPSYRRRWAQG